MPQHRSGGARPRRAPGPVPGRRLSDAVRRLSPGRRGGHAREAAAAPPGRRQDRPLRAMLMTPWLAAGAGVVVAAALALHVPHAELTYTPSDPNACSLAQCEAAPGAAPAQPAGQGHAAQLRHGRKGRSSRRRPHVAGQDPAAPGRLQVRYQTLSSSPSGFTGLITLSGQAVRGSWQLTFRYPAARVLSVAGAAWTVRNGTVVVTGPGQSVAGHHAEISLQASGSPSSPVKCTFDGVACTVS